MSNNWSDHDSNLKLSHIGDGRIYTVSKVGMTEAYDPNSNTSDDVPSVTLAERPQQPYLVSSANARQRLQMLFGDEKTACVGKRIFFKPVRLNGKYDKETKQFTGGRMVVGIVGEWTDGDTWREIVSDSKGNPMSVRTVKKPISQQSGESSPHRAPAPQAPAPPSGTPHRANPISPTQKTTLVAKYIALYGVSEPDAVQGLDQIFQKHFNNVAMQGATYEQAQKVLAHLLSEEKKAKEKPSA